MYSLDDTIVALATPPGRGGLGVVRLSGPRARDVARALIQPALELAPRHATLVRVAAPAEGSDGSPVAIDEAIATFFPATASYTGEDVVEFSLHGSAVVQGATIGAALSLGARMAGPGEFTLRAFLNGRLDLTRAEAVNDLVEATTPVQAMVAFDQLRGTLAERIGAIEGELFELVARLEASGDFPEEGYHFITPEDVRTAVEKARLRIAALLRDAGRGRLIREGVAVAIVGRPNVGKSTLFNRLAGAERAIVTAIPGTTRDVLTESVMLLGTRMLLADTAGLRATDDPIEREGVSRAEKAGAAADLVLVVLDATDAITEEDRFVLESCEGRPRVIVFNKCDVAAPVAQSVEGQRPSAAAPDRGSVPASRVRPGTPEGEPHWLQPGGEGSRPSSGGEEGRQSSGGEESRHLPGENIEYLSVHDAVRISALTGEGVDELVRAMARAIGLGQTPETPAITNVRHVALLQRAELALSRAAGQLIVIGQTPEEVVLSDLRDATEALQEVSGKRTNDDVLDTIFSKFCIGK